MSLLQGFASLQPCSYEAKFHPDEGHLSLFKKNAEEIIRTLGNESE